MKAFLLPLVLTTSLALAAESTPPPTTRAAKMKPDAEWREYPTRLVGGLPGYQSTTDARLSKYGGDARTRLGATGFFRTEKSGDRWWLVDPEGHPFIHVGVVAVSCPPLSGPLKRPLPADCSSREAWAETTAALLHRNGFNGAGAWSDAEGLRAAKQPVAYTKIWNFMSSYGHKRGGIYQKAGHMGYPKDCIFVFDPEFPAFCDEHAKRLAATKDDPWLLGHFSDNELPFYLNTLDNFLRLPKGDPGRTAVDRWLTERRKRFPDDRTLNDRKREEFLEYVADTYLRITSAAIRKYDPNHLCLGPRFTGQSLRSKAVFRAAGRHLDVIAVNYYHAWSPDPVQVKSWLDLSGKPFMVTEWYAKGMDSGFANTSGAGWVVGTQADRGRFYQNFALGLIESRGCVGWHWFKYRDNDPNDKKADPSNTDSNKGIVDLSLKTYEPLMDSMRELNRQVYSLADYFDGKIDRKKN